MSAEHSVKYTSAQHARVLLRKLMIAVKLLGKIEDKINSIQCEEKIKQLKEKYDYINQKFVIDNWKEINEKLLKLIQE